MNESMLLTIFGSIFSVLLAITAWFSRETLLRVVKIEVKLETNATKQAYIEKQSNEDHREILKLRDRVHSLEGAQAQLIDFINNYKGE